MKRKPINARLRFLRCITLLVALSFSFGNVFPQIAVSTTVPTGQSDALNVGVGTAIFSVVITNTGSSTTHISSILINQPTGVSLVSATSTIGTAVVNNNSIVLNIDLPAYQTFTVEYLVAP